MRSTAAMFVFAVIVVVSSCSKDLYKVNEESIITIHTRGSNCPYAPEQTRDGVSGDAFAYVSGGSMFCGKFTASRPVQIFRAPVKHVLCRDIIGRNETTEVYIPNEYEDLRTAVARGFSGKGPGLLAYDAECKDIPSTEHFATFHVWLSSSAPYKEVRE